MRARASPPFVRRAYYESSRGTTVCMDLDRGWSPDSSWPSLAIFGHLCPKPLAGRAVKAAVKAAGAAGAAGGATIWPKPTGEENMQFMQVKWLRSNALTGKTRVARLGRQKAKRVF